MTDLLQEFGRRARATYGNPATPPPEIVLRAEQLQRRHKRQGWALAVLGILALALGTLGLRELALDPKPSTLAVGGEPGTSSAVDPAGICDTVDLGGTTRDLCLGIPGTSVWRVDGVDYLVAVGGIEFEGIPDVVAEAPTIVAVELDTHYAQLSSPLRNCIAPEVADAVASHLGEAAPPYSITTCSPSYSFVTVPGMPPEDDAILLFEQRSDSWTFVSDLGANWEVPAERCAAAPSYPAPSGGPTAEELCSLLGT